MQAGLLVGVAGLGAAGYCACACPKRKLLYWQTHCWRPACHFRLSGRGSRKPSCITNTFAVITAARGRCKRCGDTRLDPVRRPWWCYLIGAGLDRAAGMACRRLSSELRRYRRHSMPLPPAAAWGIGGRVAGFERRYREPRDVRLRDPVILLPANFPQMEPGASGSHPLP